LIVVNKPFGVGVISRSENSEDSFIKRKSNRTDLRGIGKTPYTLQEAVPLLRKALEMPELVLVKSTEK
jgi:hypothetical protein